MKIYVYSIRKTQGYDVFLTNSCQLLLIFLLQIIYFIIFSSILKTQLVYTTLLQFFISNLFFNIVSMARSQTVNLGNRFNIWMLLSEIRVMLPPF